MEMMEMVEILFRRDRLWSGFLPAVVAFSALGADPVMPTVDKTVNRSFPEDRLLKQDTEYKRKFEEMNAKDLLRQKNEAERVLHEGAGRGHRDGASAYPGANDHTDGSIHPNAPLHSGDTRGIAKAGLDQPGDLPDPWQDRDAAGSEASVPVHAKRRQPMGGVLGIERREKSSRPARSPLVFAVSRDQDIDETLTVLPAGSFVKARVVSGVEANTLEPYPVLLQLEYAFTGPNQTRIDLSNCFMIAKARANLSTERVIMETDTLSCVSVGGEHFKTSAKGYTAGTDSTFGSTGTFISKQGQVLLAAVLASVAKNAGEALATAQTTTTLQGADRASVATNVTGNQGAFVAGKAVVDGAAMVAQWYLDYARQLIPSIAVGSGETVHVVMLETIRVPVLGEE